MKYFVLIFMIFAVSATAQIPLFGSQAGQNGQLCPPQTLDGTAADTVVSGVVYYQEMLSKTGAATLCGGFLLSAGSDALATIQFRLVMNSDNGLDNTVAYDSTDWHTLSANTGDYIPAEDDVTSSVCFWSVDLAGQDSWKPHIGIQVRVLTPINSGMIKLFDMYIILTDEYNYQLR